MSLPVALDTNVLVRLLTNDDAEQARRAADLIDASVGCFVPITVVLELEWVLRGAYRLPREAVIQAVLSREVRGAVRRLSKSDSQVDWWAGDGYEERKRGGKPRHAANSAPGGQKRY